MATLQATILEREAKAAAAEEIRSQLNYLYQLEIKSKQSEQKRLLQYLRNAVLEQVNKPKFQDEYLQRCFAELESLPAK